MLRAYLYIGIVILAMTTVASVAMADSSTFTEAVSVIGVNEASPSIPAGLTAAAVSTSQIDLSWNPSTPAYYGIAGYRILRNGSFIATTTTTMYSDQGLASATQYTYTVQAFDTDMNVSSSSDPASATTFTEQTQAAAAAGSSSSGGSPMLQVYGVTVDPGQTRTTINFSTTMPTQSRVMWGKTDDHELGSVMSPFYGNSHEVLLAGLTPGTTYHTRILATNVYGVTATHDFLFSTAATQVSYPLSNPSDFHATAQGNSIGLSWMMPADPRVTAVRIVRSDIFFPRDQFDGAPVYEGSSSFFMDTDVQPGKTYYYAIFSEAVDGSFSSGALTEAVIPVPGQTGVPISFDPFATIPQAANVDPMIAALKLSDFVFSQNGLQLIVANGDSVVIDGSQPLTISLPYEKVPEVLKTIAITLQDPEDPTQVFPFLLRVNSTRTAYEATIGALGHTGIYKLQVVILDYQNQGLKRIPGSIRSLVFTQSPQTVNNDPLALVLLVMLTVIMAAGLIVRNRNRAAHTYA